MAHACYRKSKDDLPKQPWERYSDFMARKDPRKPLDAKPLGTLPKAVATAKAPAVSSSKAALVSPRLRLLL